MEDIAARAARVDAQVMAVLGGVMPQRRSVEVAFAYAAALSPGVRANCRNPAEAAGHEARDRMKAPLRSNARDSKDLLEIVIEEPGESRTTPDCLTDGSISRTAVTYTDMSLKLPEQRCCAAVSRLVRQLSGTSSATSWWSLASAWSNVASRDPCARVSCAR
jgi:hypothetical protein